MTIKDIVKNSGMGSSKNMFERYQHGGSSGQGGYYGPPQGGYSFHQPPTYHASPPSHVFKHFSFSQSTGGGGSKGGGGAALSALTLLSFLFFLNILQQCLKDQMMTMSPQVMVMSSTREDNNMKKEETDESHKWAKIDTGKQVLQKRIILVDTEGKAHLDDKKIENTKQEEKPSETKMTSLKNSENSNDVHRITALKKSPVFVFAMGEGIGEAYSEN